MMDYQLVSDLKFYGFITTNLAISGYLLYRLVRNTSNPLSWIGAITLSTANFLLIWLLVGFLELYNSGRIG